MSQYLLKFFKNENYMNQFLDGNIYMKTFKYFKNLEKEDLNRSDRLEGISSIIKKDAVLKISDTFINVSHFQSRINQRYDFCSIFCLYKSWDGQINEPYFIDEKNKGFGDYCVQITNVELFLQRIVERSNNENFVCNYSSVEYKNKYKEFKTESTKEPFTKLDEFKYQNEFRIIIDTKRNIDKEYILEIGSLKDISTITTIDKINYKIKTR